MHPVMKPPTDEELAEQLRDLLSETYWQVPEELHGIDWFSFLEDEDE